MAVQTTECEGCHQTKAVPMIEVKTGSPPLYGICAECVVTYGMQVGQRLRLHQPGRLGETDVQFLSPADNAIWIRHSDGTAAKAGWSGFDKID